MAWLSVVFRLNVGRRSHDACSRERGTIFSYRLVSWTCPCLPMHKDDRYPKRHDGSEGATGFRTCT